MEPAFTLEFLSYALIRGWHNLTRFDLKGKGFFRMNRIRRLRLTPQLKETTMQNNTYSSY